MNPKIALRAKALQEAGISGKLLEKFNERFPVLDAEANENAEGAEPTSAGKKPEMKANEVSVFGLIVSDEVAEIYAWLFGEENITTPSGFRAALNECEGDVTLRIDSVGGFIKAADVMIAAINEYDKGKVDAKINGWCASAATIVAIQAENIQISEFAEFMIHRAAAGAWGNAPIMQDVADSLAKTDGVISNAYAAKSGKKPEEMLAYMDKETWFSAAEAVEVGLCDAVMAKRSDASNEGDGNDNAGDDEMNKNKDDEKMQASFNKATENSLEFLRHLGVA